MRPLRLVLMSLLCAGAAACASTGSVGTSSGNPSVPSTSVSSAVPGDVVISSPTASTTSEASGSVSVEKTLKAESDTADPLADYQTKREALQTLLAANGACTFPLQLRDPTEPNCYGPRISYANHPDADGGEGQGNGPMAEANGMLPPHDVGIWNVAAADDTTACAAAQANYLIARVAQEVDRGVNLFGAMACAAQKEGIALPSRGAGPTDLTTAMHNQVVINGLTISSAQLEYVGDTSDGDPIYASDLVTTVALTDGTSRETEIHLRHIPTTDDNSTYVGRLAVAVHLERGRGGLLGNCSSASLTGTTIASVIDYVKGSATDLDYRLKFGEFCGQSTVPFDSAFDISAADRFSASNQDGWANDWNYGLFDLNPSAATGTVAYAWQAGADDGYTRVLNVQVSAGEGGAATGTAHYGYGPAAHEDNVGAITGFFCNWAGPNNRAIFQGLAQRQELVRAADATKFTAESSNITYAPTNSCDAAAGDDFTYFAFDGDQSSPQSLDFDNDRTSATTAVTNNLVSLSGATMSVPTSPTLPTLP